MEHLERENANKVETNEKSRDEIFWQGKKQNFINLQLWEDERGKIYSVLQSARHKHLLDTILSRILQRCNIGKDTYLATAKFLKERASADIAYSSALMDQLIYLPSACSKAEANLLKAGLVSVSSFQESLSRQLQDFHYEVENNIIKTHLAETLLEYDTTAAQSKIRVEALHKELDWLEKHACVVFKDLELLVKTMQSQISTGLNTDSCYWLAEKRYFHCVGEQMKLQKAFASYISSLWRDVQALEVNRVKSVKTAMEKFVNLHKQIFATNVDGVSSALQTVSEDMSNVLRTDKLLANSEIDLVQSIGGDGSDPIEDLFNWELPPFQRKNWVLFRGELLRETSFLKKWKPCYCVFTTDRFFHVFKGNPATAFNEPISSYSMNRTRVVLAGDKEHYFQIEITHASLFGAKKQGFKAHSQGEFEHWVKVINEL